MMWLQFAPQCCDADVYLSLGELCAGPGDCWYPYYPVGTTVYFSIPYRLGMPPEFVILQNLLLMGVSVYAAGRAFQAAWGAKPRTLESLGTWLGAAAGHLAFMWPDAWHSLTDVPSSSLALTAGWLSVLGLGGASAAFVALAGLSWSLAVLVRVVYLYPAALATMATALLAYRRRTPDMRRAALLSAVLFVAPLAFQCAYTYAHVKQWALLDFKKCGQSLFFSMAAPRFGRDTVLPLNGRMYDAADCFRTRPDPNPPYHHYLVESGPWSRYPLQLEYYDRGQNPILDAVRAGDWWAPACVWLKREWFYFGSYAPNTYLRSAAPRAFSLWILSAHLAVLALAARFLVSARRRLAWLPACLFAAAVYGTNSLVVAESRYMMGFQTFFWSVGLAGGSLATLRLLRGFPGARRVMDAVDGRLAAVGTRFSGTRGGV